MQLISLVTVSPHTECSTVLLVIEVVEQQNVGLTLAHFHTRILLAAFPKFFNSYETVLQFLLIKIN